LTLTAAFLTLWLGHRWLKVPLGVLGGVLGGLQTQPAVLAFALDWTYAVLKIPDKMGLR
jgi:putative transport protein